MTPLDDGINRLRKAIRTNNTARLAEAIGIPYNQLDAFANGSLPERIWRHEWEDRLDAIAEYFFSGHRRYQAATDTLVTTHTADPMPSPVNMPQEEVETATSNSFGAFFPSRLVKVK